MLLAPIAYAMLQDEPLAATIERVRTKYGLPSICAGAILDGKIVAVEAVGVRHVGSNDKVTVDDPYHCGSITKSFTAVLVATYVQEGRLTWDMPLANLFPSLAKTMDPGCAKITPRQLMAHRSGLSGATWPKDGAGPIVGWKGEYPSPRDAYARLILSQPQDHPAETQNVYSNANYVLLGAILEGLTGSTWERLLTTRLLRPLGLKTAGFGAVCLDAKTPGAWGHVLREGRLVPVPPGPNGDNPLAMGPAGTLHMSVPDLLRWCAFQADEGRYGGPLAPASFEALHKAPFGGDYAGGLCTFERDWGGGMCLFHNGSNTMNYESMWISPRKRFGVVVAINAMTPAVNDAVEAVTGELIRRYCPK